MVGLLSKIYSIETMLPALLAHARVTSIIHQTATSLLPLIGAQRLPLSRNSEFSS